MTLYNKTRAEIETSTPMFRAATEEAELLECLNTFYVWALKTDISVTPSLKYAGYWEAWITAWFTNHVSEGDFIVDIGANCGYYTMLFETLVGPSGSVIAYEASERYCRLLEKTREDNEASFVIKNLAVADKPGELTLTYPGNYTGSASVVGTPFDAQWGEEHYETVQATTLDLEFKGKSSPDLIKIDAESAEEFIWNGAKELLSRPDAPTIVLEYSPTGTYSDSFDEALFDYGNVTRIGFDGLEEPVSINHVKSLVDWDMLVIRKK